MKLITTDNFDREGPEGNDKLIAENVSLYWGTKIVKLLNQNTPKDGSDYFRVVEDDYKLKEFQP
jgi:hypothetical protein